MPYIDSTVLTLTDYERIKQNAYVPSKEEILNQKQLLKAQEETQMAKARALKQKILDFDKTRPKYELSDLDRENIQKNKELLLKAQKALDNNEDCVKEMDKLSLYAKVATIRDKQLKENKILRNVHKKKEEKLDIMMELERLKELKANQDREALRRKIQREGCLVVVDQIKQKELEKIRHREMLEKEAQELLKQYKEMQEQEQKELEKKKVLAEQTAKEIVAINQLNSMNKQKAKLREKEENLKILQYNMDKAKKEEAELLEKKRLMEQKEKEIQKLREKQAKAQDNQAELDAIRAKRAFEDNERAARKKEREEMLIHQKKIEELIRDNERQKKDKEMQLAEMAKNEQEEYLRIVRKQLEDVERERKMEEEKKRKLYEHNMDLRRMIKIREEKEKVLAKEVLEEGRKQRQVNDSWRERMEKIKQDKIQQLKDLNIDQKYIVDLEKYKIN